MLCDLCEEMIVEIFSRLPTKSLLRFRSLSKALYTSIGCPDFIRLHTLRSPEKVMIKHKIQKKHFYTLHHQFPYNNNKNNNNNTNTARITPVAHPFSDFRVIGSCNGILCLCKYYGQNLILWNPSTRRKVTVPDPPIWQGNHCSEFEFVFGFDPIIDDYKILRITNGKHYSSYVYTIKTRTWRAIASSPTADSLASSHHCLFKGASHCVAFRYGCCGYRHFIMKFDLASEVFSKIELAEPSWEKSVVSTIKGCLAVMSSKDDSTWIWVMREYGNPASWSVAFKLNACQKNVADRFYTANDDQLILLDHLCEGIVAYNPETHQRSKLLDFIDSSSMVCMTVCIESLELLDMGTIC
ncbi:F-box/kelch-repeat protein At3g06240-like [Bidens hawaiensis]|uniref:F-box/kelch-repeat protein At3g06240-like n=1 Tax=Bidens hawaiensis TaxID=980011 RepID=UPI00404A109B